MCDRLSRELQMFNFGFRVLLIAEYQERAREYKNHGNAFLQQIRVFEDLSADKSCP
jgi:hypothetical protein